MLRRRMPLAALGKTDSTDGAALQMSLPIRQGMRPIRLRLRFAPGDRLARQAAANAARTVGLLHLSERHPHVRNGLSELQLPSGR